jgi:methyl-accepting chemotaxis protein
LATINKPIALGVLGSELALDSGVQMQATQETTAELATAVSMIAKHSLVQAHVSNNLREQTEKVQQSTRETSEELKQQASQTGSLVQFSKQLLESVNVFKLPA